MHYISYIEAVRIQKRFLEDKDSIHVIATIVSYVGTAGQYMHNMTCLVIIVNNVSCNIKGYA